MERGRRTKKKRTQIRETGKKHERENAAEKSGPTKGPNC